MLRNCEVTHRVKVLASKPIDLSSVPISHKWRKRTNSHKLSSDIHIALALWSAHDYVCVCARTCTHAHIHTHTKQKNLLCLGKEFELNLREVGSHCKF